MVKTAFVTRRFLYRPAGMQDATTMVKHLSNPLISKTTLHIPHPYTHADAETWIARNAKEIAAGTAYTFVIIPKGKKNMIGAIGLHLTAEHSRAEAGYWVAVPHWNKGIATEALGGILKYGFEVLRLNKIFATHIPENAASGSVMVKSGMTKEGTLRSHYKKERKYITVIQYAITRREYKKQNHPQSKNKSR